jgi:hypothetical protein
MQIKVFIFGTLLIFLLFQTAVFIGVKASAKSTTAYASDLASFAMVQSVDLQVITGGSIPAQNQVLHFHTPGELISIPGAVTSGQTIAQLDSNLLHQQLRIAANTHKSATDGNHENLKEYKARVLEAETKFNLDHSNKNGYSVNPETYVIYAAVQRMVDEIKFSQYSAERTAHFASYAVQRSTLASPIIGIAALEDVTTPGINVTMLTSFIVKDLNTAVFRANIRAGDMEFISGRDTASISPDGNQNKIQGSVSQIHPSVITRPGGEDVNQVDMQSPGILTQGKLDQGGLSFS